MPVKAVVGHVGAPTFEVLHLNLAAVSVEVGLDVLLLELQGKKQPNTGTSSHEGALDCVALSMHDWKHLQKGWETSKTSCQ